MRFTPAFRRRLSRRMSTVVLTSVAASTPLLPVAAQNDLRDIPVPDPEVERASFQLAQGLEVNLFAADPMLKKPVQINWDARGRLWVASSTTYPQIKPGESNTDQIIVLEDTNGDGVADTSTVFADNLLIPTGLFPTGPGEAAILGFGTEDKGAGCYVANSTELLFLRDTDGDGRADQRHVLLSGFGTEDTHHIIHTFRGAPDGSLYFNQSVYIHAHVETPWGVRRLGGGGVWHFRPETSQLEIFTRGQVNPWGHVIDQWGQSFTTDGAYSEGVNYAFPGAAFFWAKEDDWTKDYPRILKGLNPGQPKHCGLEMITGRHFPEEWRGTMVLPDFRGNRINRFVVTDNGSGYAGKQVEDVIKTDHRAFRPVDVRMGPDGALYIADWYNPIIQHGEVDFRDARRDHTRGRIWRLTVKGQDLVERPKLAEANAEALLELLTEPEDWTRFFAKRELRERFTATPEAKAALAALVEAKFKQLNLADSRQAQLALELYWVGRQAGLRSPWWLGILKSAEPRARAAAVRALYEKVLAEDYSALDTNNSPDTPRDVLRQQVLTLLTSLIRDDHPRVRLEAIHCLRILKEARATELALAALELPVDENIDFALWQTCRDTQDVWLPAFQRGEITFGGNFQHAVFALKATGNPAALQPLVAAWREGKITEKDRPAVLELIATMGGPAELALLLEGSAQLPAARQAEALDLLTRAVRARQVKPSQPDAVLPYLTASAAEVRRAAARLVGALKLEAVRPQLEAPLRAAATESADFQAALDGLLALGGPATARFLEEIAGKPEVPVPQRAAAVAALASANVQAAAVCAITLLTGDGRDAVAPVVFDAFLTRKEGPAALAQVLKDVKLSETVARVGLQRTSSAGGDTQVLQEALMAAAGLQPINQVLSEAEMAALVKEVREKGDPHRGEAVYRRKELLCTTCHAIGGGGPLIGPDLVSIGASAQIDYLIESLLNPSAKIKEGYHTTVVTTKDGGVFAGAIVKNDGQTVTLRDAAGNLQNIPAAEVVNTQIQPISLMPPGLTASLPKSDFLDLVAFMSHLGREGDFKVPAASYVRRWRVLQNSEGLNRAHNLLGDRLFVSDDEALVWQPAYSLTNGALPAEEAPHLALWNSIHRRVYLFELEVTTPGAVTLAIAAPNGLRLLHGEAVIDAQPEVTLQLSAGLQKIAVVADPQVTNAPVRIELKDTPGAGRARLVMGP